MPAGSPASVRCRYHGGRRSAAAAAMVATVVLGSRSAWAQGCGDDDPLGIGLTAGVAAGVGAGAAFGSSGILATADDTRDYSFAVGGLVGAGVSAGLAGLYAIVDGSTGCTMVQGSGGFVWSIPITTFVVGALLPVAIWGAADDTSATADVAQAVRERSSPLAGRATLVSFAASF